MRLLTFACRRSVLDLACPRASSHRAGTRRRGAPMTRRRAGRRAALAAVTAAVAALTGGLAAPTAAAVPSSESWAAELAVDGGDDSNVIVADGAVRLRDLAARTTSTGP